MERFPFGQQSLRYLVEWCSAEYAIAANMPSHPTDKREVWKQVSDRLKEVLLATEERDVKRDAVITAARALVAQEKVRLQHARASKALGDLADAVRAIDPK